MEEKNQATTNIDSNLMAALSYVWILSVVMLILRKNDSFVRFHAKQGTVLFFFSLVAMVLTMIVFVVGPLVWITVVVLEIIGFIKALSGDRYKIPIVHLIARSK